MRAVVSPDPGSYPYASMGYANPDAVTQVANGVSTTTYAYDNNGNLISSGTGTATTTYTYDYANRLIALFAGGATTTYGYDAFGARVIQTGTTTTLYPFKWYSVASSTGTGAKYATTTSYVFNGDTLLATVDQQLASGAATGTAKTRYVHPDHLGSTNVVTDENDNLVQTLDYYPYGATRVSVATSTNEKRKYIDQFADDSGLSYLNARYYDSARGQFLSQDPTFLAIGNPNQLEPLTKQGMGKFLTDPQQMNSYNYARGNPITNKDPSGLWALKLGVEGVVPLWGLSGSAGIYADQRGIDYYYSAGLAMGGGVNATAQISTTDLGHTYGISTGVFAAGGVPVGAEASGGMTYYPYSLRKPQPYIEGGLGLSAEVAVGGTAEVSGPLWVWNANTSVNMNLAKPQIVNSFGSNQNASGRSNAAYSAPSTWGGSSSGMPSTVTQNGVSYVRNASGLLNVAH
jgi:RHS repeat-associated protein